LFKDYPFDALLPANGITIGLPRVLDFWRTMPFWNVFWGTLGFKIKVSRKSSMKLYEKGLRFVASDTVCFPAKLVHGHIQDLVESKVDRIFMPQLNRLPPENSEKTSTYTCPVLKGYPLSIKYSNDPDGRHNVPFDAPLFHWFSRRDRDYQLCLYMKETFNLPKAVCRAAIRQGDKALALFNRTLTEHGRRIIEDAERRGTFAVVLAGRDYQYDELVCHNLPRYFTGAGVPVLTLDALPNLQKIPLRKTRMDITNSNHARLLSGAIIAARNPALEYVDIYSFGCGHDALYTDEITRLLREISGKPPLILKMDESDIAGPLRIRVRSFIETVTARRKKEASAVRPLEDPYPVKYTRADKAKKVILIPNVTRAFCDIMSACLVKSGYRAEPLPMGGAEARALGKKYVHNDICFPAQMVIGEAIFALQSGAYDLDNVAVGTGKMECDCRLTNYMMLTRKALDDAGFPQVPIIDTDQKDIKNLHPGFKFGPSVLMTAIWSLIEADVLEALRRKIRPYEIEEGETDRVTENAFAEIARACAEGGVPASYRAYKKAISALCGIRYDRSRPRERVSVQGEYLLTFHSGCNFDIEQYLEQNGMEAIFPSMHNTFRHFFVRHTVSAMKEFRVRLPLYDTLYAIIGDKFIESAANFIQKAAKKHPLFEPFMPVTEGAKLSDPVMHHSIRSGESYLISADILHHAANGVRCFVILQPFGCLPNHICGRGVIKKIKELYPDIHILPLDYDPDVSFANIENRLQMLLMNARSLKKAG
jgi:predicted nucleotide-binding protein (sugar kinase/HSP70/actin superfamily)